MFFRAALSQSVAIIRVREYELDEAPRKRETSPVPAPISTISPASSSTSGHVKYFAKIFAAGQMCSSSRLCNFRIPNTQDNIGFSVRLTRNKQTSDGSHSQFIYATIGLTKLTTRIVTYHFSHSFKLI